MGDKPAPIALPYPHHTKVILTGGRNLLQIEPLFLY